MSEHDIASYLRPGRRVHLIGIGGVSMCPLAEVLSGRGVLITGSDIRESEAVAHLRSLGIPVSIGHRAENLDGAACVVRTAAVHDANPEIAAARARGVPVFERAQAWGEIMLAYRNALCIAGTHGKTTTTSMSTHILMAAGADPTVMIGGTLPLLHAGHRVGRGDTIVMESCEYCNSFLWFYPTVAVILNIEADHLDFFKDLEDVEASFRKFAERLPEDGVLVVNRDDGNAMKTVAGVKRRLLTFGLAPDADVRAEGLVRHGGAAEFDILVHGELYAHAALQVPGLHNVTNALAAAAGAFSLGVPGEAVERGLSSFTGAHRRFERKGTYNGAAVYDDYAHHPGELHALFQMAMGLGYGRVVCAFQPHTYTRTKALFDDFVRELSVPDVTILAEIFAAREQNDVGISSRDLASRIPGARSFDTLEEVADALRALARPGDLILTVGAGDIYLVGESLTQNAQAAFCALPAEPGCAGRGLPRV
ncbi:MAG TPA: UDP-N-acetylmuramate--L-alanine ligase [Oscillospiraceae bacterium]|nr:UDP-N-acetylmuramate--L-alanine ligase [Oscillospiraceae bacterium]